ncbi:protein lin-37 homolog [Episyrphus balteatus]|uniref:protein lin-37 homolog n=1 Tax=Episyrphus balteatus TaxID=286459 RepID=UPI002485F0F0|nr:protein lin-37 homolog [Episyrphus balteatus]
MHNAAKYAYKRKLNEVQMARGRLKTALHDLVANSDDDEEMQSLPQKEKQRGRPKKSKIELEDEQSNKNSANLSNAGNNQMHESFVMKLFDRSLDLSKYDESTPLYPICRAWIDNTPRSPSIRSYRGRRSPTPQSRENDGGEVLEKLRDGELHEITSMPAPLNTDLFKIPSSLFDDENEEERKKTELSLKGASKAELLAAHKRRSKKVRLNWQKHSKKYYEHKYELNFQIIDELYKC